MTQIQKKKKKKVKSYYNHVSNASSHHLLKSSIRFLLLQPELLMAVCNEQISKPVDLIAGILITFLLQPLQVLGQLAGVLHSLVAERRRHDGAHPIVMRTTLQHYRHSAGGAAPVVVQPERAKQDIFLLVFSQRELDQVHVFEELDYN